MRYDAAGNVGRSALVMSLGGTTGSQRVADAVAAAYTAGVLVLSAAGNSECCNTVMYPATYPGSMAVAAVDRLDVRATFREAVEPLLTADKK